MRTPIRSYFWNRFIWDICVPFSHLSFTRKYFCNRFKMYTKNVCICVHSVCLHRLKFGHSLNQLRYIGAPNVYNVWIVNNKCELSAMIRLWYYIQLSHCYHIFPLLSEVIVPSYSVVWKGILGLCFYYWCTVSGTGKWWGILWPAGRVRLFAYYTHIIIIMQTYLKAVSL